MYVLVKNGESRYFRPMSKRNLFDEFPPVSIQEWEEIIERDLKGADYKNVLKWKTGEGIEALPFYRREDRERKDITLLPAEHRWSICQRIYEQDMATANQAAKKAVDGGADALLFEVELQNSIENIEPDMRGIAVQSQEDFSALLNGISLEQTALHFNAGMLSPAFAAMLLNECERQQVDSSKVNGTFGYDPFSFILKHGRFPNDKKTIAHTLKQLASTAGQELPNVQPLRVDAGVVKNAGATIAQELGYALAAGSEYLAMAGKEVAPAIHFNFAISGNYFLEIAKLRAARRLWPQVLKAYGVEDTTMVIHGITAEWNKSRIEPHTNIIRQTTEGMAAAIGGCDVITVQPFDAVQQTPNEFSQRIARNTQLILQDEARLDKVADPSAGSWYIETLTDKLAEAGWKFFQEIEQQGGLLQSIKEGTLQPTIGESRNERASAIKNKEQIIVGVNKYIAETNDESEEIIEGEKTVLMRKSGNSVEMDQKNLIRSIKKALKDGVLIGDIASTLFDMSSVKIEPIEEYKIEK